MRTIRRLAIALAAFSLLGGLGIGAADTAVPTSTTTAGAHAYSMSVTAGSVASTGTLQWDNTTWALTLTAKTGQLAAGSCVTVYFDWRAQGHHDARGLRDCRANDTFTASFPDDNTKNLGGGPSRMGICYGKDDTTGTCTYYMASSGAVTSSVQPTSPVMTMDWSPWPQADWTYPCILSWTKKAADGTVSSFLDAHSRRRLITGTTC